MSKRVLWLELSEAPYLPNAIVKSLRDEEFTEESTSGFIIDRSVRGLVEARYIERFVRPCFEVDPFGQAIKYERIVYSQTKFTLVADCPFLELHDPPRSVSPALNALMRFMRGVTVTSLEVDVLGWLARLRKKVGRVRVTGMAVSEVSLAHDIKAQIVIKGSSNVSEAAKVFLEKRKHVIDRLDLRTALVDDGYRLRLYRSGKVVMSSESEELLQAVRDSLSSK